MYSNPHSSGAVARFVLASLAILAAGCGESPSSQLTADESSSRSASPEEVAASSEILQEMSKILNEADIQYRPLDYAYDEDLLEILERVDDALSGKTDSIEPRPMPKLEPAEELDHFRETIRRWTAATGKSLPDLIAPLKADVEARKPGGPAFHPEFHKKFSDAFNDLIPIEVAEIRERRNTMIHKQARPILDRFRESHPELVKAQEEQLNAPPYQLPTGTPAPAGAPGPDRPIAATPE